MELLSRLPAFPIRPPTPPRGTPGKNDEKSEEGTSLRSQRGHSLDTPDESPGSSSERSSKRVDFLPCTTNDNLSTPNSSALSITEKDVRPLPPSRECKPSRSILKPFNSATSSDPTDTLSTLDQCNFPKMLEGIAKELASSSRSSRLDAYKTLNGCLKAYDDLPDTRAIAEKMPLLTGFIRRDLSQDLSKTEVLNTQFTTQVLKLVTIFIFSPTLSDMLSDDFRCFLLDQCTARIQDPKTPKVLVNHYMLLLATQSFRSKIMNNERATRLLTVLNDITSHVTGNGVVGQRLMIYRKLLFQANSLMIARVADWIDHLFAGMLSNMKEIRARALSLGFEASLNLGTNAQVSRAVGEVLNRGSAGKPIFVQYVVNRLDEMLSSKKEEGLHVPQIWIVVILFFRTKKSQLQRWEHWLLWIGVIQRCFNSSSHGIKFQANLAWNRLIFAIGPDAETSSTIIQMLWKPIRNQMHRVSADESSKQAKQVAFAGYCTLLYYSFPPGATHATLDLFWDGLVGSMLPMGPKADKADLDFSCQVLVALLGDNTQKLWNKNRANESTLIKPAELPRLDPRWVRINAGAVLPVVRKLLDSSDWQAPKGEEAWILRVWRSFTLALADAGSKEIKVSMDSMTAMAALMSTIKAFLVQCTMDHSKAANWDLSAAIRKFIDLVRIAVTNLGAIPFSEKRLTQPSPGSFEAAETPSSRLPRQQAILASPIIHLIEMLSSISLEPSVEVPYRDAIQNLIEIAVRPATSRRSKLKSLRDITQLFRSKALDTKAKAILWERTAYSLIECFELSRPEDSSRESPHLVGHEYREAIKILEAAVHPELGTTIPIWLMVMDEVNSHIKHEIGAAGSAIALIEPLANFLGQQMPEDVDADLILRTAILIENTSWVESRKELDRAQRLIWGAATVNPKSTAIGLYDSLLTLLNSVLDKAYQAADTLPLAACTRLIRAVESLLVSCPLSLFCVMLKRIQNGLGTWIVDAHGHFGSNNVASMEILPAVLEVWAVIVTKMQRLEKFDSTLLSALQVLLVAGLGSRHRSIVGQSITMWNSTFGRTERLEYPDTLLKALIRVRALSDILLPGLLPEYESVEVLDTPFQFVDTQADMPSSPRLSTARDAAGRLGPKSRGTKEASLPLPSPQASAQRTPEPPSRRLQGKSTPKPRLRHDNSQILFTAIESSPLDSGVIDSQLLTGRQKEVKERQQHEAAAMFPDLRSSPRPKSREASVGLRLSSRSKPIRQADLDLEGMSSPTLPSANDMATFLGSSPSPVLRRSSSRGHRDNDDPPSSPPLLPTHPSSVPLISSFKLPQTPPPKDAKDVPLDEQEPREEKLSGVVEFLSTSGEQGLVPIEAPSHAPDGVAEETKSQHPPSLANALATDDTLYSDVEVFIDAPTSPVLQVHAISRDENGVNGEASHKSREESAGADEVEHDNGRGYVSPAAKTERPDFMPRYVADWSSDHEAQISAQIANDMEMALSQAQRSTQSASRQPSSEEELDKTRKRDSASPAAIIKRRGRPRKKPLMASMAKEFSAASESDMLDCIIVLGPVLAESPQEPRSNQQKDENSSSPTEDETRERPTASQGRKRKRSQRNTTAVRDESDDIEAPPALQSTPPGHLGYSSQDRGSADLAARAATPLGGATRSKRRKTSPDTEASAGSYDSKQAENGPSIGDQPEAAFQPQPQPNPASEEMECASESAQVEGGPSGEQATGVSGNADPPPAQDAAAGAGSERPGMLEKLKGLLGEARGMTMAAGEGHEILSAWMDLGRELHDAERRSGPAARGGGWQ